MAKWQVLNLSGGANKSAQIGMLSGTEVMGKIKDIKIVGSTNPSNNNAATVNNEALQKLPSSSQKEQNSTD